MLCINYYGNCKFNLRAKNILGGFSKKLAKYNT